MYNPNFLAMIYISTIIVLFLFHFFQFIQCHLHMLIYSIVLYQSCATRNHFYTYTKYIVEFINTGGNKFPTSKDRGLHHIAVYLLQIFYFNISVCTVSKIHRLLPS